MLIDPSSFLKQNTSQFNQRLYITKPHYKIQDSTILSNPVQTCNLFIMIIVIILLRHPKFLAGHVPNISLRNHCLFLYQALLSYKLLFLGDPEFFAHVKRF